MDVRIALAGNPNSGKTTLFNALTGSNQFVGNWPGVTVEKKEGKLKKHEGVTITDLPGMTLDPIGTRNGNFVLNYLTAERIPIVAQDLFGVQPRKVCFFVRTGRTLVKRLPAAGEIARVERAYRSQLAQKPVAGSVELF